MTGYLINDYISSIIPQDIAINYENELEDNYIFK